MMLVSLVAFAVGALLATLMPLVQFALGLVIVALSAVGFSLLGPGPMAQVVVLSLAACGCAQVGYVAGVGAWAIVRHKRLQQLDQDDVGRQTIPPLQKPL